MPRKFAPADDTAVGTAGEELVAKGSKDKTPLIKSARKFKFVIDEEVLKDRTITIEAKINRSEAVGVPLWVSEKCSVCSILTLEVTDTKRSYNTGRLSSSLYAGITTEII